MANTKQIFIMLVVLVLLGTAGVVWSRNGSLSVFKEKDKDTSFAQADDSQSSTPESSHEDEQKEENEKIRDNDEEGDKREDIEDDDGDDENEDEGSTTQTSQTTSDNSTASLKSYTAIQVAAHANQSSCWSIIDSNVYDLTAWISKHPGGEGAILGLCGKDGTALFHGEHGTNAKQANILTSMKIGMLVK